MKEYRLRWSDGEQETLVGEDLKEACEAVCIVAEELFLLESFECGGQRTKVAGQAGCGCVHYAEDEVACQHDLERVGLGDYKAPVPRRAEKSTSP